MQIQQRYLEILGELEASGIMPDKIPSLVPVQEGLRKIGFFESELGALIEKNPNKVIVIAGTNGKGSTAATLEALLLEAGEKVGLYSSPHLIDYTERIRFCGQDISKVDFCESFDKVKRKTNQLNLSHFEKLTLMAIEFFMSQKQIDRVVLEVGLGGLWDATNAVPHGVCVITALGKDHERYLGKDLTEIASNKFGIIPKDKKSIVFYNELPESVLPIKSQFEATTESHWIKAKNFDYEIEYVGSEPNWALKSDWGGQPLNLPGARGIENTSLALTVFQGLGYEPKKFIRGLSKVRWPGRMEKVSWKGKSFYLSGDHNPQGIQSLIELLKHYRYSKIKIIVGVGQEKDLARILEPLLQLSNSELYITETPFRGRALSDYGEYLSQAKGAWASAEKALNEVIANSSEDDMILVTGSLYLVGEIKGLIK